jgi:hypothetical protein
MHFVLEGPVLVNVLTTEKMRGKKIVVIIIALALLLAALVALRRRREADRPECVGDFAINRRPGLRGSGRDAGLQFRPRTLGDPRRHHGLRSWTAVRSGKSWRPGRQDSTESYRAQRRRRLGHFDRDRRRRTARSWNTM